MNSREEHHQRLACLFAVDGGWGVGMIVSAGNERCPWCLHGQLALSVKRLLSPWALNLSERLVMSCTTRLGVKNVLCVDGVGARHEGMEPSKRHACCAACSERDISLYGYVCNRARQSLQRQRMNRAPHFCARGFLTPLLTCSPRKLANPVLHYVCSSRVLKMSVQQYIQ